MRSRQQFPISVNLVLYFFSLFFHFCPPEKRALGGAADTARQQSRGANIPYVRYKNCAENENSKERVSMATAARTRKETQKLAHPVAGAGVQLQEVRYPTFTYRMYTCRLKNRQKIQPPRMFNSPILD